MAEQIKVGVVLEFQGLSGVKEIPAQVKTLLETIQRDVDSITAAIKFDSSSLQDFAAQIAKLESVVAELKALAANPINVKVEMDDQSITAIAEGMADAFIEALTKVRDKLGAAGGVIGAGAIGAMVSSADQVGDAIGSSLLKALTTGVGAAKKAVEEVAKVEAVAETVAPSKAKGKVKKSKTELKEELGQINMFAGIAQDISKAAEDAGKALADGAVEDVQSSVARIGKLIGEAAADAMLQKAKSVGEAIANEINSSEEAGKSLGSKGAEELLSNSEKIGTGIANNISSEILKDVDALGSLIGAAIVAEINVSSAALGQNIGANIPSEILKDVDVIGALIGSSIIAEINKSSDEMGLKIGGASADQMISKISDSAATIGDLIGSKIIDSMISDGRQFVRIVEAASKVEPEVAAATSKRRPKKSKVEEQEEPIAIGDVASDLSKAADDAGKTFSESVDDAIKGDLVKFGGIIADAASDGMLDKAKAIGALISEESSTSLVKVVNAANELVASVASTGDIEAAKGLISKIQSVITDLERTFNNVSQSRVQVVGSTINPEPARPAGSLSGSGTKFFQPTELVPSSSLTDVKRIAGLLASGVEEIVDEAEEAAKRANRAAEAARETVASSFEDSTDQEKPKKSNAEILEEMLKKELRDSRRSLSDWAKYIGEGASNFTREMFRGMEETRQEIEKAIGRSRAILSGNAMKVVNVDAEKEIQRTQRSSARAINNQMRDIASIDKFIVKEERNIEDASREGSGVSQEDIDTKKEYIEYLKRERTLAAERLEGLKRDNQEIEIQLELVKDRNKLLSQVEKVDRVFASAEKELTKSLQSTVQEAIGLLNQPIGNLTEAQVRALETYGQVIAGARRDISRAADVGRVQQSVSRAKSEKLIEEREVQVRLSLDPDAPEEFRIEAERRIKDLDVQIALEFENYGFITETIENLNQKMGGIADFSTQFKSASNLFRLFSRVAEEPLRVIEKTGRTSERLNLSFKSLQATHKNLIDTFGDAIESEAVAMTQSQAIEAKRFLQARERQMKEVQKAIQDQAVSSQTFEQQIRKAQQDAMQGRPTMFAYDQTDPDRDVKVQQQADALIEAEAQKSQKYVENLRAQLAELEDAAKTASFQNIRASVSQFESFDELAEKIQKASNEIKGLGIRSAQLARDGRSNLELDVVSGGQLRFDSTMMDQAQKDFNKTTKEVEALRTQVKVLEDAGFDTSAISGQLTELSLTLRSTSTAFDIYGKSVERITETRNSINRIENLNSSVSALEGRFASSTDELAQFAREIANIETQVGQLDQDIAALEAEYRTLEGANDNAAAATKQAIEELKRLRDQAKKQIFGDDFVRNQEIIQLAENLEKAKAGTVDLARAAARMSQDIERASAQLSSVSPEDQLQGVNTFKRLGSEASSAVAEINDYIFSIRQAAERTGGLTAEQGEQIAQLERLRAQFESTSGQIRRGSAELDRVRHSAERAGQGMEIYSREVADSVLEGLKFVQAATLIGSVLGGLRTVFDSMIESSKQFARTMTVLSSTSMSLTQIYSRMKKEVTDTAIAFGVSVEDTAEILKQFGSAGFTAEESFAALTPTMKTLIATSADAEQLARATAGIYKVYGDELKAAGGEAAALARINDVLVVSYRDHSVEMDELVQGYKFTANSAKLAGFSLEELTGLLSVLNDNMLKSGMAGRSLNAVFAQIAAKSDQAEEVFGFKFDPNKTIASQFIPFLETVNKRIGEGAILTSELDKQFKFFDRQGAKGFQTLVTQLGPTIAAMENFKNQSAGAADELSDIIRDDFANQFERAKQAALAFGKDFIEPLKPLFIALGDIVVALREISARNPEVAAAFGWIGAVVGGILFLGSSIKALFIVFTVLASVLGQYTIGAYNGAKAAYAAGMAAETSGGAAARASALWRSYATALGITKVAADGTSASITVLGRTASAGAGWVGVLLTALTFLIPVFASFSDSSAEINREFENITSSIKQIDREIRQLDKFEKSIDRIAELSKNAGISHEMMGQKIRDAFDQAGDKAVNYGLIVGRTNKQIGESTQEIINKTREQIAEAKRLQQIEKDRAREQGRAAFSKSVSTIISDSDIQGALESVEYSKRTRSMYQENIASKYFISPISNLIFGQSSEESDKKFEKKLQDQQEKIAETAKNIVADIQVKALEQAGNFDSFVQAYDQAKKDIESSPIAPEIKNTLIKELEAIINSYKEVKLTIDQVKDVPEVFEGTIGTLNRLSKEIGGIGTDTALFDNMINGAITLREELTATDNQLAILRARLDDKNDKGAAREISRLPADLQKFDRALKRGVGLEAASIPVQLVFNKDAAEKSIKEFGLRAQKVVESTKDAGNLNRLLGQEYAEFVEKGQTEAETAAKTIDNVIQNLILVGKPDILGNTKVSAEQVARLVEIVATATGKLPEEAKAYTAQLLDQINAYSKLARMEKLRQQTFADQLKLFQQQANVQNIMNDRGRAGAEASIKAKDADRQRLDLAQALRDANQSTAADLLVSAKNAKDLEQALEGARLAASQVNDPEDPNFAKNVQEASKSIIQARADTVNAFQGIAMADRERIASAKRLDVEIVSSTRNLKGQVSAIEDQIDATREINRININLMRANGRLNGSYTQSLDAINELKGSYKELLDLQKQLTDAITEENVSVFSSLEEIEKLLNPKNPLAGVSERIGKIKIEVNKLATAEKALNKNDKNYQSERIKLTSDYIEKLRDIFDLQKDLKDAQDKMKEAEKASTKFVEDRVGLYRQMNEVISGESQNAQKVLQESLKKAFEAEKSAVELQRQLGNVSYAPPVNPIADALANIFNVTRTEIEVSFDFYSKKYAELVAQGKADPLFNVGGDIALASSAAQKLGAANREISDSLAVVRDSQMELARKGFEAAIGRGDLEAAQEYFNQLKGFNEEFKQLDSQGRSQLDRYMAGLKQLADMAGTLAKTDSKEVKEIKLALNVTNPQEINNLINEAKVKLQSLKVDLKGIIDPTSFQNVVSGQLEQVQAAFKGEMEVVRNAALGESPLVRSLDSVKGALNDLKIAIERSGGKIPNPPAVPIPAVPSDVDKNAKGGKIIGPGSGTSDSILSMVSNGEYVVRADAVSHYGTSFFDALNSKSIKRFANGGQNGNVAAGSKAAVEVYNAIGLSAAVSSLQTTVDKLATAVDASVNAAGSLSKAADDMKQVSDNNQKAAPAAIVQANIQKGKETGAFQQVQAINQVVGSLIGNITSFIDTVFGVDIPDNIKQIKKDFKKATSEIGKSFQEQMDDINQSLSRNKSSYFDYINSIQDAEEERLKALLEAEKEYQEQVKQNYKEKTAAIKQIGIDTINGFMDGISSTVGSSLKGIFDKKSAASFEKAASLFGEGMTSAGMSAGLAGVGAAAAGTALEWAAKGFGELVDYALMGSKGVEKLTENLDNFIGSTEKALETFVETFPLILDAFFEKLPDIMELIGEALIAGLLAIVEAIGRFVIDLPVLVMNLIKGALKSIADGDILEAIGRIFVRMLLAPFDFLFSFVRGFFSWFGVEIPSLADMFLGTYHEGGVIPGNQTDVPIIAQGGEGVLSRQGMLALGGAQNLDKLNQGVNPFLEDINRYHSGGVVGETMTRDAVINRQPSSYSSSVNTSNNISVNVTVNGSMDSRQMDQMTNKLVNEIDGKLSKKVQDRDSRLARTMANRK